MDTKFASRADAKAAGNFSRRHHSSEAHFDHRLKWDTFKSPEGKQRLAADRAADRAARSPAEQIADLDRKLGKGKGAKKERERLAAQSA